MNALHRFISPVVILISLTLTLTLIPQGASAQIQPGLWEVTGKIKGGNSPLMPDQGKAMQSVPQMSPDMVAKINAQSAQLAPEQRKAMEVAMEAMKNMRLDKNGNTTMKVCLTKEMIATQQFLNQDGKCSHVKGPMIGNTQKFNFNCTEPVSIGEGTVTYQSNASYTGSLKIKSVQNGKPVEILVDNTGKFIDANCGSVKPMPIMAK
jgi:Protein of unknown function (DUF3617)